MNNVSGMHAVALTKPYTFSGMVYSSEKSFLDIKFIRDHVSNIYVGMGW